MTARAIRPGDRVVVSPDGPRGVAGMSGVVVAVHRADEYSTRRATVDFNLFDGPARYLIGLTYLGRLPSATKAAQR